MIKTVAVVGFLLATLCSSPFHGIAQTDLPPAPEPEVLRKLREEIRDGFYARINLVTFGLMQQLPRTPSDSDFDLDFARYQTELDVRPDFRLNFRRLELRLKPRLVFQWRKCNQDSCEDSPSAVEPSIHEWLVQYRIADPMFVSYGRQNLAWGPSYLLSPSNPFNANKGLNNPQLEVPGLDYGQIVWIPSASWTLSAIANTDDGGVDPITTFKKGYAIKLDYTGEGKYFSLIPSYREDGEYRVGFFGGWTLSDALLLHLEGDLSDQRQNPRMLIGGSYTLASGPTLTIEYYRRQNGCSRKSITRCEVAGSDRDLPEGLLLRKNYLLLQYVQTRILDMFHVTGRWIRNLDDGSNRFVGIFNYEAGSRTELFLVGNILEGDRKTEFGGLFGYSLMLGAKFTF